MQQSIRTMWVTLAVAGVVGVVMADPVAQVPPPFRCGADERIRQEYFDHIPISKDPPGVTRGGENDYFRFRTRAWVEGDVLPGVTLRARIVNETRAWVYPDMSKSLQRSTYNWPDEWVFDNLYVNWTLLDDKVAFRVGRQELIYGTGKVILEGTPKDGSRTIYFTAAKAA